MKEELREKVDKIFEGERLTIPRDTIFTQILKAFKEAGYIGVTPEEADFLLKQTECHCVDWTMKRSLVAKLKEREKDD